MIRVKLVNETQWIDVCDTEEPCIPLPCKRYDMKNNAATYSIDELQNEIREKNSEKICGLIRKGVLEELSNEELKSVFRSLMGLRSKEVIDLLAKRSHYFPIEMLDVEIRNHNDKDFVSWVLIKYGKKFKYKEHGDRLFEVACDAECRPYLLFLLGKGLGESQYPRLASGPEKLFGIIHEIRVRGLHPDTIVTFFVEAAISDHPEENIRLLIQDGFDIGTVNSEGLTAGDALRTGIENFNYGKDKRGQAEKQKDLQGLKTLERICREYEGLHL